jgi:hypothetical protein
LHPGRGPRASWVLLPQHLEKLQAAGAKVGAPINGVGDPVAVFLNEVAGFHEVGVVRSLSQVEEVEIVNV